MPRYAEAIGLDLGSRSAKAAHVVRRRGVCTVANTVRIDLPPDGRERGQALRRMVESQGWSDLPCVALLRGDALVLRALNVPPSDPRSLRQVTGLEMKEVESLSATETLSHCVKMPAPPGYRRALLAVTRSDVVEQLVETYTGAGFRVTDVVPGGVALLNTFCFFAPGHPGTTLLVDLARDVTDVVVVSARGLLFARSFSTGADLLLAGDRRSGPGLDAWVAEVQSCLALYRSQFPDPDYAVASAVLSGGAGAIETLSSRLAAGLGLEVQRLEDLPTWKGDRDAAFFASAVGLALAGLGEGPVASSLLPAPLKEKQLLQGQIRYWVLSASAAILAMVLLVLRGYRELEHEQDQLQADRDLLMERRQVSAELATDRAGIERLRTKVGTLEVALGNGELLRSVIDAVAHAKAADDWITLIADSYSYFAGTLGSTGLDRADTLSPASLGFEELVVEGYTPVEDLSTVRAMIEALRKHPAIADADLLGDDRLRDDPERDERWAPAECTLFAIEITVSQP